MSLEEISHHQVSLFILSTDNLTVIFIAYYIDSGTIKCRVPAVTSARSVEIAISTTDGGLISQRAFLFAYVQELLILDVIPKKGSLEGEYEFTILGNFEIVVQKGLQTLFWGEEDITDRVTSVETDKIVGLVPPSDYTGRR